MVVDIDKTRGHNFPSDVDCLVCGHIGHVANLHYAVALDPNIGLIARVPPAINKCPIFEK